MTIAETLLPEFDREMATTRRLLERVPEDKLSWAPHPKSMALGALSEHLGQLALWGRMTIGASEVDLEQMARPPGYQPLATREALLAHFDREASACRAALVGRTDAEMMAPWTLRRGAQAFFTMPKATCWRTFVMNHLVHHRGQLSVYLRLLDVPLPSIYGPSADESPF
jgi:uncharacterized damage-inducible protein DinB